MIKRILIADILRLEELQIRFQIDKNLVNEYAGLMQEGATFPPVDVFDCPEYPNKYVLADGFHRVEAAEQAGFTEIDAEIHEGDFEDADLFAALKYLKSKKWQGATVREIAKAAGVHCSTVAAVAMM